MKYLTLLSDNFVLDGNLIATINRLILDSNSDDFFLMKAKNPDSLDALARLLDNSDIESNVFLYCGSDSEISVKETYRLEVKISPAFTHSMVELQTLITVLLWVL